MPGGWLKGAAVVLALGAGAALWLGSRSTGEPAPLLEFSPTVEAAPMCPWREPERDLRAFFPGAETYRTETRVLSARRLELTRLLGRAPTAEENALYLHQVDRDGRFDGTVLTRRVKGEYGAIEVVLGIGADGKVRGVRLQRQREPEPAGSALQSEEWLDRFRGRDARSGWSVGEDLPLPHPEAVASAEAVAEGVRSMLVLWETAMREPAPKAHH
jgi:hypothetical protein